MLRRRASSIASFVIQILRFFALTRPRQRRGSSGHISSLPSSQGARNDLQPVRSQQFCQFEAEPGLRRARCKQHCPRIGCAVMRMRQWESRLVCRAVRRSPEGRQGPQREPKLIDKKRVTMSNLWQVQSNEERFKSWFSVKKTKAEGASFNGWHRETV